MKLTLEQVNSMKDAQGNLDLFGHTELTALPDGFTVGGWVNLSNTNIKNPDHVRRLHNRDYVPGKYLYADGILTHVKKKKKVGDYTYFVGKIPGKNVVYDGKHYAHCSSLRDGIADLLFKSANERGADQYKNLSLDTEMALEEMVTMYRVITGACRQGSQDFVDGIGDQRKDRYTIREAIDLTKGQYGAGQFAEFFEG